MATGNQLINRFEHFSHLELELCEQAFMLLRDCIELDSPAVRNVLREFFPQIQDAKRECLEEWKRKHHEFDHHIREDEDNG